MVHQGSALAPQKRYSDTHANSNHMQPTNQPTTTPTVLIMHARCSLRQLPAPAALQAVGPGPRTAQSASGLHGQGDGAPTQLARHITLRSPDHNIDLLQQHLAADTHEELELARRPVGDTDADDARLGPSPHFVDAAGLEADYAVFLVWRNGRPGRLVEVSIHGKMDGVVVLSDVDGFQIEANESRNVERQVVVLCLLRVSVPRA
ncbi:hypothetical protein F5144DRAFT_395247 [Chaetomium tenue]|uniref:Uncharacterized protein n=1 Tax=Chaetomium tenue TaxID=1854479 RepID=A0ACB7P028_9PEZI|nr:hypothetical protein F5144DRAFT_395247 [Chaetomium globosum]